MGCSKACSLCSWVCSLCFLLCFCQSVYLIPLDAPYLSMFYVLCSMFLCLRVSECIHVFLNVFQSNLFVFLCVFLFLSVSIVLLCEFLLFLLILSGSFVLLGVFFLV